MRGERGCGCPSPLSPSLPPYFFHPFSPHPALRLFPYRALLFSAVPLPACRRFLAPTPSRVPPVLQRDFSRPVSIAAILHGPPLPAPRGPVPLPPPARAPPSPAPPAARCACWRPHRRPTAPPGGPRPRRHGNGPARGSGRPLAAADRTAMAFNVFLWVWEWVGWGGFGLVGSFLGFVLFCFFIYRRFK